MATIKNVNSIQEYIMNITNDINNDKALLLNSIALEIKDMLHEYTQTWYDKREPSTYDRTYEFINSLTIKEISIDEVEVGFDANKMSLGYNNGWSQHEDRFYPLSEIIDSGWEQRTDGSHALENTIAYMSSNVFKNDVTKKLKKYGYTVI